MARTVIAAFKGHQNFAINIIPEKKIIAFINVWLCLLTYRCKTFISDNNIQVNHFRCLDCIATIVCIYIHIEIENKNYRNTSTRSYWPNRLHKQHELPVHKNGTLINTCKMSPSHEMCVQYVLINCVHSCKVMILQFYNYLSRTSICTSLCV